MPKKFKQKRTVITDHIFRVAWLIQRGGTEVSAFNWYRAKEGLPKGTLKQDSTRGGYFYDAGTQRDGLLWFDADSGSNSIIHEVQHAVVHLAGALDMKMTEKNQELFAYYAGWLGGEIVTKLWVKK